MTDVVKVVKLNVCFHLPLKMMHRYVCLYMEAVKIIPFIILTPIRILLSVVPAAQFSLLSSFSVCVTMLYVWYNSLVSTEHEY